VYVKNEQGHPLMRLCPGRRSFGGFNPGMEEYATLQLKEHRKAAKLMGLIKPRAGSNIYIYICIYIYVFTSGYM